MEQKELRIREVDDFECYSSENGKSIANKNFSGADVTFLPAPVKAKNLKMLPEGMKN